MMGADNTHLMINGFEVTIAFYSNSGSYPFMNDEMLKKIDAKWSIVTKLKAAMGISREI